MARSDDQAEMTEQRFNRLILAGIAIGFVALLASGIGALFQVRQNERHTFWVNHTYRVERQVSRFRVLLERAEAARRGMLLSDDPIARMTYSDTVGRVFPALDEIGRLTGDNPRQQATVDVIRPLLREEMGELHRSALLALTGHRVQAADLFSRTRDAGLMRGLRLQAERLLREEDRLLALRDQAQQRSLTAFLLILAGSGVLLVLVALAAAWLIRRYTRDLHASRTALRLLNEDLEGAVQVRTTDLRRANEEIQRFAYIVSHDLRSPLVNVMGFTAELEAATRELDKLVVRAEAEAPELVSKEARLAAREDLPEAIGFIRTSTQKMDRLINAILRLSREGRRTIMPEPLDMDALAQAVMDTLKHRSDELGATVTIAADLPRVVSDRVAVEQILSNIVENALKYLRAGRPGLIEIGGRREGTRVQYTVRDNGRGIDPRDHQRIFDLFRRSGVQDQPGEGIGLAHTRALAYRLGGGIEVESVLGEGAAFCLTLPADFVGEKGSTA